MNSAELGFVAFTLLGAAFVLWELVANKSWKLRSVILMVGLVAGLAGAATVLGYHEVCCTNYRASGEYKRDGNNLKDWTGFLLPLGVQLSAFGVVFLLRHRRLTGLSLTHHNH